MFASGHARPAAVTGPRTSSSARADEARRARPRTGGRIIEEVVEDRGYLFTWDSKRRLVNRDVNPFGGLSKTAPCKTLDGILTSERLQKLATDAQLRLRRRKVSRKRRGIAIGMLLDSQPLHSATNRKGNRYPAIYVG